MDLNERKIVVLKGNKSYGESGKMLTDMNDHTSLNSRRVQEP